MFRLNETLMGLVNSAPYLCSAFSCWSVYIDVVVWQAQVLTWLQYRLTQPLNDVLGRRGTIFLACIFSASFCLGQAFSWNWQIMFTFRFLLGLGMGPKSATIPIYASECAPANVRGALVMMWQIFTAFGIMCGYICGAALRGVLNGGDDRVCQPPEAPGPSPHLLGLNCVSICLASTSLSS